MKRRRPRVVDAPPVPDRGGATPTRLPGLDLLRAVAVVWVMLFHSFLVGGLGPDWSWLSRFGWAGVDVFFVLSGFLIGTQLLRPLLRGEPLALRAFYARRAWRIVPAYAVVLAVYAAAPALREAPGLESVWQFATFTLNLFIDYTRNQAFSHAWSLCVEEQFYLLFPLVAAWAVRRRLTVRAVLAVAAAVVAGGIALRMGVWLRDDAAQPARNWFIEDIYYPTWMRLDGLLAGVLLAALHVARPALWARLQRHATAFAAAGVAVVAAALVLYRDRTGLAANAVGWPLLSSGLALLVLAGAAPRGLPARLALPGTAWLAAASYSLYLSHKLALHAVQQWLAPALQARGPALFALHAAAVLALGAALHHGVERPFLRRRDRRPGARATRLRAA